MELGSELDQCSWLIGWLVDQWIGWLVCWDW